DRVDWGQLRQARPVSNLWGQDRGRPLDRIYVETFLSEHKDDIRGATLEIKDAGYSRWLGEERVTSRDVLDIDAGNTAATIHADLTCASRVPSDRYDCFILTQTLNVIHDTKAALSEAFRVLKPGGVLLCTVSALGRISYEDKGLDGDHWRFTEASLRE